MSYVDHAHRHLTGGSDPLPFGGPAAKILVTTSTLSCGSGFGAYTTLVFETDFDNIGLVSSGGGTIFTLPAGFAGGNPVWDVHLYLGVESAGSFLDEYQLWIKGPVNPVLYFTDVYFDSSEFEFGGYQSDGHALGEFGISCQTYLNGPSDLLVQEAWITVVYLGQSGPTV